MDMYVAYQSRWRRRQYLNDVAPHNPDVQKCFLSLFFFEEKIDKPLPEFTPSDLDAWRDGLPTDKRQAYTELLSHFVHWTQRKKTKTFNQEAFERRLVENSNSYVASPYDLSKRMGKVFGPVETGSKFVLFRCYLWLLYMGVRMRDALLLEEGAVNLDKMEIQYQGWPVKIPDDAYPDFSTLMSTDWMYNRYGHPQKKPDGQILLRWYNDANTGEFNVRLLRNQYDSPYALRPRDVYQSGVFYRTFLRELDGIPADLDAYTDSDNGVQAIAPLDVDYMVWKYLYIRPLTSDVPAPSVMPRIM